MIILFSSSILFISLEEMSLHLSLQLEESFCGVEFHREDSTRRRTAFPYWKKGELIFLSKVGK